MIDAVAIASARDRLKDRTRITPARRVEAVDQAVGATVLLKLENEQVTGSFKARGAANAVFALSEDAAARGVATHSSGNHGAALAWAANRRGIPCTVVVPENALAIKQQRIAEYGATLIRCAPTQAARESELQKVVNESGATAIPPFNHPDVIAGQATCTVELIEQAGAMDITLDVVVAPIGGGGLLSGTTLAAHRRGITVIGAEPAGADDAARSLAAGTITPVTPDTIADGLRMTVGAIPFAILQEHQVDIIVVPESSIEPARRWIHQVAGCRIEPSCAVAVAAVLDHRDRFAGQRIGLILSGGNVENDPE